MNMSYSTAHYQTVEYGPPDGSHDDACRRPRGPNASRRREMPQAFNNTAWGRDEAGGLHRNLRDEPRGPWPTASIQRRPILERKLSSSSKVPQLSKARDESFGRPRERNYGLLTRESLPKQSDLDSSSLGSRRPSHCSPLDYFAHEVHRQYRREHESFSPDSGPDRDIQISSGFNARRPTVVHQKYHRAHSARRFDSVDSNPVIEYRPQPVAELPAYQPPQQPLRRSRGRPRPPSWWT